MKLLIRGREALFSPLSLSLSFFFFDFRPIIKMDFTVFILEMAKKKMEDDGWSL